MFNSRNFAAMRDRNCCSCALASLAYGTLARTSFTARTSLLNALASKIPVGVQVGKPSWAQWLPNLLLDLSKLMTTKVSDFYLVRVIEERYSLTCLLNLQTNSVFSRTTKLQFHDFTTQRFQAIEERSQVGCTCASIYI